MIASFIFVGWTMSIAVNAKQNFLLANLPTEDFRRLLPHISGINMGLGRVLYESGEQLKCLYFPTTAIASLMYVTENGASTELAVAGREGAVGIALFMGGNTTNSRAIVQSAGDMICLPAAMMEKEFERGGPLQWLLLRYTQALIAQMTQTAVCNRHHTLEQQLCRWLLISVDRLNSNKLRMTQQLIADMLGVRREGVTEAAGKLQSAGAIRYSRGDITIIDRDVLEARVCECYRVVNKEYDRLLHDVRIPRDREMHSARVV